MGKQLCLVHQYIGDKPCPACHHKSNGVSCLHDGMYRYCWVSNSLRHTTYFNVVDGLIVESPNLARTPLKRFAGKELSLFHYARMGTEWEHQGDRCLQVSDT